MMSQKGWTWREVEIMVFTLKESGKNFQKILHKINDPKRTKKDVKNLYKELIRVTQIILAEIGKDSTINDFIDEMRFVTAFWKAQRQYAILNDERSRNGANSAPHVFEVQAEQRAARNKLFFEILTEGSDNSLLTSPASVASPPTLKSSQMSTLSLGSSMNDDGRSRRLTMLFYPYNDDVKNRVRAGGHTPRLQLRSNLKKTVAYIVEHLTSKWNNVIAEGETIVIRIKDERTREILPWYHQSSKTPLFDLIFNIDKTEFLYNIRSINSPNVVAKKPLSKERELDNKTTIGTKKSLSVHNPSHVTQASSNNANNSNFNNNEHNHQNHNNHNNHNNQNQSFGVTCNSPGDRANLPGVPQSFLQFGNHSPAVDEPKSQNVVHHPSIYNCPPHFSGSHKPLVENSFSRFPVHSVPPNKLLAENPFDLIEAHTVDITLNNFNFEKSNTKFGIDDPPYDPDLREAEYFNSLKAKK